MNDTFFVLPPFRHNRGWYFKETYFKASRVDRKMALSSSSMACLSEPLVVMVMVQVRCPKGLHRDGSPVLYGREVLLVSESRHSPPTTATTGRRADRSCCWCRWMRRRWSCATSGEESTSGGSHSAPQVRQTAGGHKAKQRDTSHGSTTLVWEEKERRGDVWGLLYVPVGGVS